MILYLVTNLVNGKRYVGKTTRSLGTRWSQHVYDSKRTRNCPLHAAIRKHGPEAFSIEVLDAGPFNSEAALAAAEISAIARLGTAVSGKGYNATLGGEGVTPNQDTRRKMVVAARLRLKQPIAKEKVTRNLRNHAQLAHANSAVVNRRNKAARRTLSACDRAAMQNFLTAVTGN